MTRGRPERIAMLGAGSWGTALAVHLRRTGHDVRLWARDETLVRRDPRAQDQSALPERGHRSRRRARIDATVRAVLDGAAPSLSPFRRTWFDRLSPRCATGFRATPCWSARQRASRRARCSRMSQVIADEMPVGMPVVVLSGPSFALEVARGLPTAVLAASTDASAAAYIQECFRGPSLRLYGSDDVAGVEIGGALKNVIAIAAGVVEGLGLGHNSMAALITRGLAEISRLAGAEGGRRETLVGIERTGRSRADVHRRSEPESPRRDRVGRRAASWTTCSRACAWSPKASAPRAPRLRSVRVTGSSCRSLRRCLPCSRGADRRSRPSRSSWAGVSGPSLSISISESRPRPN